MSGTDVPSALRRTQARAEGATRSEAAPSEDVERTLAQVAAAATPQAGAENFPVALRVVPKRPRAHLMRIYAYARFVDDLGDNAPGDRLQLLDAVAADVRALYAGTPQLPVVAALAPLVAEHGVPAEPFLDLVEANRLDQRVARYETFEDLVGYCVYSANPVGLLVLYVADAANEANRKLSDDVCTGLQILEHCQDVGEDAERGRVYLPAEELRAAGVDDAELQKAPTTPELRRVIGTQVGRSVSLLAPGRELVRNLKGWARIAIAGYVGGGLATADALRAANFDVLTKDIHPSRLRTARHALQIVARR